MPKLGMEPIRRAALIDATIVCIGRAGTLDVTVGQIAKEAGVSSGLAHHYFGSKDHLFLAAMRHVLRQYGAEVRAGLAAAEIAGGGPRARLDAVLAAGFSEPNFRDEVVAAWLNFYVLALISADARRLLSLYQRRLRSNLLHALRPLIGAAAPDTAERIGGLIDGLYLRHALSPGRQDGAEALRLVRAAIARELNEHLT